MPSCYIYVPFPRTNASDLRLIMQPLDNGGTAAGTPVTVIYRGEENNQVVNGDTLVVNAHGADGTDTKLYDNTAGAGGKRTVGQLTADLNALSAQNAARVVFVVCFSAVAGHVARTYKANNPTQTVYGSVPACEGGDFFKHSGGRGQQAATVRNAVWDTLRGMTLM
jgi:hypothetical protein